LFPGGPRFPPDFIQFRFSSADGNITLNKIYLFRGNKDKLFFRVLKLYIIPLKSPGAYALYAAVDTDTML
jgi:hypothetical protein